MVEVKFTYPKETGYPFKSDRTRFENAARDGINRFLGDEKVKEVLKEPLTLELVISKDGEITPMLPSGEVFLMPLDEALKAWQQLIDDLKKIQ